MTTTGAPNSGVNLLKMLGAHGIDHAPAASMRAGRADLSSAGFAELLGLARRGEVSSGRDVTIDPGVNVDLTPDQRSALAAAADRAEAAGLNRALVIVGGRGLVLDVASRSVTATTDITSPTVLSQIDGVVSAGAAGDRPASAPAPGAGTIGNATLAQVLARSETAPAGTRG